MRAGKVWGDTRLIEANGHAEMHHASIKAGMCCSKHMHATKWNGFYVVSGELLIRVWQKSGLVDETRLGPGDYTKVPPGIYHRFECLENTECIELYWPELQQHDIVREDIGGAINPVSGLLDALGQQYQARKGSKAVTLSTHGR